MNASSKSIALALAALAIALPTPGRCQSVDADTAVAAVAGQFYTAPVIGIDPASGEPHLAFTGGGMVHHAWRSSGVWTREVVAVGGSLADFVVSPAGVPRLAYLLPGGAVVSARRAGGAWMADTAAMVGGTVLALSLALDPANAEPAIAILAAPAADSVVLRLARHAPGGWTTVVVDTGGSAQAQALALAIDATGRPLVAWSRGAVTGPRGLVLEEGAGALGPFASAVIDTGFTYNVTLALDPATQSPRLAHHSARWNGSYQDPLLFYSWRHPSLGWLHQWVPSGMVMTVPRPVSLVLDPLGNAIVTTTSMNAIAPHFVARNSIASCGFVETGSLEVWTRPGGEGPLDFALGSTARVISALGSRRAVASTGVGTVQLAWREPHYNSSDCPPLLYWGALERTVSVAPPGPAPARLAGPFPNPWRPGAALTVSFALPRAATAALEVHDVSGRRVARREPEALAAGTHVRAWDPGPLAPGLYWLSLRLDGARVCTRTLVAAR